MKAYQKDGAGKWAKQLYTVYFNPHQIFKGKFSGEKKFAFPVGAQCSQSNSFVSHLNNALGQTNLDL